MKLFIYFTEQLVSDECPDRQFLPNPLIQFESDESIQYSLSEEDEFYSTSYEEQKFKGDLVQDLTDDKGGGKDSMVIDCSPSPNLVSEEIFHQVTTEEDDSQLQLQKVSVEEGPIITLLYLETLFPRYPIWFATKRCCNKLDSAVKWNRVIGECDKVATGKIGGLSQSDILMVPIEIKTLLGTVRQRVHPQVQNRQAVPQHNETSGPCAAENGHIYQ